MAKEICISSTPHETRLAILEEDQLAEIYYERENEYTLAGSIYNGRVTRVLPGMQSAFVDIGLERDAFLYVTDFLELEDQEESDELEKAAAGNPNQPPREVHHGGDRNGQRSGQRSDQKQEPRQERPAREQRPAVETEPLSSGEEFTAPQPLTISEQTDGDNGPSDEQGAKRWRGRRRRRGGRGTAGAPGSQSEAEESPRDYPAAPPTQEAPATREIQAAAVPAPRADRAPAPFVLPGESLSRYGGTPAGEEQKSATQPSTPVRPASTFRPSTLIEAPIEWDGSGPLPGESLSRHRNREAEQPAERAAEPREAGDAADLIEEEAFVEEMPEFAPEAAVEPVPETKLREEAAAATDDTVGTVLETPSAEESATVTPDDQEEHSTGSAEIAHEFEETSSDAPEPDRTASHHVDSDPSSGFRLFGLGGKKKKTEEPAQEAPAPPKPASVASVSAFAPGTGLIEEEVIEGEEFEAPHHHHKGDEHDLDEYEEETLQTQIRSGELGEMLQEAHLDHRIQLDFDEKNGEEEEDEDEEEEPVSAEGQPAGADVARPQRDRGGRGRRGG
ncbi:MAG: hypothetical protein WAM85_00660, partial [Terracidiphilus sp.]